MIPLKGKKVAGLKAKDLYRRASGLFRGRGFEEILVQHIIELVAYGNFDVVLPQGDRAVVVPAIPPRCRQRGP